MARVGKALRTAETVGLPAAPEHQKKPAKKAAKKPRARNAGMFKSEFFRRTPFPSLRCGF